MPSAPGGATAGGKSANEASSRGFFPMLSPRVLAPLGGANDPRTVSLEPGRPEHRADRSEVLAGGLPAGVEVS